jgi:hypothetical protein
MIAQSFSGNSQPNSSKETLMILAKAPVNVNENDADELLLEVEDEDVELDILSEMNAAPGDNTYTYRVGRITGLSSKGAGEPILFKGDGQEIEAIYDRLRDEFGDGKYRIRVMKNGRLWKRFDMAIELPKSARQPTQPHSDMAAVLSAIEQSNARTLAVIERLAERSNVPAIVQPSFDPLTMFDKILGIVKSLMPTPAPPVDYAEKSVALILQGVELAKSVEGEGREKGMIDLISDLLQSPLVAKLAESSTSLPALNLPPRLAHNPSLLKVGEAIAKDTISPANKTEVNPAMEQMKILRTRLLYLLDKAVHGSSAETYAEWIFDNWEPQLINDFLSRPEPLKDLQIIAPEITSQLQWFIKLIDELRELVNDTDAANGHPDAPGSKPSPVGPISGSRGESGGTNDTEDDE